MTLMSQGTNQEDIKKKYKWTNEKPDLKSPYFIDSWLLELGIFSFIVLLYTLFLRLIFV